jgi:Hemerythrin HHE cation binding domain
LISEPHKINDLILAGHEQMAADFSRILDSQSKLCDELEAIADGLPSSVDSQFVLRTAKRILVIVKCAHDFEEGFLFPFLESRVPQLAATLERLRYEHWGDEEFAVDIHHALREYVRLHDNAKVDALAWMLRGFFEGMRRHIAFDREYLQPKIKEAN